MPVAAENLQKTVPVSLPRIVRITRAILDHEGIKKASLTIVFVTSRKIKAMNRKYLHRNYITDVLAFDSNEYRPTSRRSKPPRKAIKEINGDIAICVDVAARNAAIFKTSCARELVLYLVHGILHLSGFDDHAPSDIRAMRRKEQEIMEHLGAKIEHVTSR